MQQINDVLLSANAIPQPEPTYHHNFKVGDRIVVNNFPGVSGGGEIVGIATTDLIFFYIVELAR